MNTFQQNQVIFLLVETVDCKGWLLSNESQFCLRGLKFCLRHKKVFNDATAFLDLWIPSSLLCFRTCFSHLLSHLLQSPEMWSWVLLTVGKVAPANSIFSFRCF